ncbi:hypothetical protein E2C01_058975 [Portunus trituberculatus]|uniref:Uncharacterized protein n=1 Tax=Portunus trituberculatus TaxID=210409 RepID=A0A5B7H452_PORTR|nr:hypothetical protein [Portunus trituberculatus]
MSLMTSPPNSMLQTGRLKHGKKYQESFVTPQVTKKLPCSYARYGRTSKLGLWHTQNTHHSGAPQVR